MKEDSDGETIVRENLSILLSEIADNEDGWTERFYELFFEKRPDVRPLFGVHSIAEQEEMMHETLQSIHAWICDEPWLFTNLQALGKSHWEYGVTSDMYASFVGTMIDCCREVLPKPLDEDQLQALRTVLERLVDWMRIAGDEAAATDSRPTG